jgi:hypothetical protein
LEKRAEQVWPRSEEQLREREQGQGGEMVQTMCAHMNKRIKKDGIVQLFSEK